MDNKIEWTYGKLSVVDKIKRSGILIIKFLLSFTVGILGYVFLTAYPQCLAMAFGFVFGIYYYSLVVFELRKKDKDVIRMEMDDESVLITDNLDRQWVVLFNWDDVLGVKLTDRNLLTFNLKHSYSFEKNDLYISNDEKYVENTDIQDEVNRFFNTCIIDSQKGYRLNPEIAGNNDNSDVRTENINDSEYIVVKEDKEVFAKEFTMKELRIELRCAENLLQTVTDKIRTKLGSGNLTEETKAQNVPD